MDDKIALSTSSILLETLHITAKLYAKLTAMQVVLVDKICENDEEKSTELLMLMELAEKSVAEKIHVDMYTRLGELPPDIMEIITGKRDY